MSCVIDLNLKRLLSFSDFYRNFALAYRLPKPDMGLGRDADIVKSVYFTLILDLQESRKFYITVKNVATVDVSGMIN